MVRCLRQDMRSPVFSPLPAGADILKIDVPERAAPETPCRWTRQSRRRYFIPIPRSAPAMTTPAPWASRYAPIPPNLSSTATSAP